MIINLKRIRRSFVRVSRKTNFKKVTLSLLKMISTRIIISKRVVRKEEQAKATSAVRIARNRKEVNRLSMVRAQ